MMMMTTTGIQAPHIFFLFQYNIKKKEEIQEQPPEEPENPLMRKKKTPEELAREAEEADQDEFTKLKNTIETQVNELKSQIESKCSLQ
ncbi:Complexin-1 [Homalodisca vitripennis]|nr:Complexin-1 [Homalodisca vitripennis]